MRQAAARQPSNCSQVMARLRTTGPWGICIAKCVERSSIFATFCFGLCCCQGHLLAPLNTPCWPRCSPAPSTPWSFRTILTCKRNNLLLFFAQEARPFSQGHFSRDYFLLNHQNVCFLFRDWFHLLIFLKCLQTFCIVLELSFNSFSWDHFVVYLPYSSKFVFYFTRDFISWCSQELNLQNDKHLKLTNCLKLSYFLNNKKILGCYSTLIPFLDFNQSKWA